MILCNIINFIIVFILLLQNLPTCPISLIAIRAHLPEISCWESWPHWFKEAAANGGAGGGGGDSGVIGNYNSNIVVSTNNTSQQEPVVITTVPTASNHKFHKYHRANRKMTFRGGRRGWCGCLQVSQKKTAIKCNEM